MRDVPARERKVSAVGRNLNVETVDLTNEGASIRPSPEALSLTNFERKHMVKMTMVNHITENQRKSRAAPSRERKISAVESKVREEPSNLVFLQRKCNCKKRPSQQAIGMNNASANTCIWIWRIVGWKLNKIKDVPAKEREIRQLKGSLKSSPRMQSHSA
ncbi:hypothetical protein NC652_005851 [Populus alba x Populus x berolinensis]|nr:hypothetical protein NC652_005851 [Populus alba x Populus x berolinensis]